MWIVGERLVCRSFFFFKQKSAYEMRISDWSSDVCSSDLMAVFVVRIGGEAAHRAELPLLLPGRRVDAAVGIERRRELVAMARISVGMIGGARQLQDRKSTRLNSSH